MDNINYQKQLHPELAEFVEPGLALTHFSLPDVFVYKYPSMTPIWGPIGYLTYKRTYARMLPKTELSDDQWNELRLSVFQPAADDPITDDQWNQLQTILSHAMQSAFAQKGNLEITVDEWPALYSALQLTGITIPRDLLGFLRDHVIPYTYPDKAEEFWQTLRRVTEGEFQIQKYHCQSLGLPWSEQKALKSAMITYDKMWNFKFLPPGRGLWMMGTEFIARHGSFALNNCFSGETEFITAEGIKRLGDCAGTIQRILTSGGKWTDAPIQSFGIQKLMKLTLKRQGIFKEIFVTADHRWMAGSRKNPYRDQPTVDFLTKDLPIGARLPYMIGQGIQQITPSPFGIAHGITFGDGNVGHLNLCDKKIELQSYFPLSKTSTENKSLSCDSIYIANLPNYFKDRPSIHENKSYLYGWLAGYFATDGSCSQDGSCRITSAIRENIEFVRDVCVVIGIGFYQIKTEIRISNFDGLEHVLYSIALMRDTLSEDFFIRSDQKDVFLTTKSAEIGRRYWNVVSVEETDREEEVFCAIVENTHTFTLADNILTGNCGFISSESVAEKGSFCWRWGMDSLMLGCGIGFDTLGTGSVTVHEPVECDRSYLIPDSREGWVIALGLVIDPFLYSEQELIQFYTMRSETDPNYANVPVFNGIPKFDFSKIRKKGAPIRGFGGKASGPDPLIDLLLNIRGILTNRIGETLHGIDILLMFANIARCVVAGNVRRSAILCLADPDDVEVMTAKTPETRAAHRGISYWDVLWTVNISISAQIGMDYRPVIDGILKNGEPGLIWMDTVRKYSRLCDPIDNKDKRVKGTNPCGEVPLESAGVCCLVEVFPAHHDSYEEFEETLKYAYLYAKTVTLLRTHWDETNQIIQVYHRIGISLSGIVDAFAKFGRRVMLEWCQKGYKFLQELDAEWSHDWLGLPGPSHKLSTVKPSGSVSLLAGASPGIHYPHSEYYIRRIRMDAKSEYLPELQRCGYRIINDPDSLMPQRDEHGNALIEPSTGEPIMVYNTKIVEIPVHEASFSKSKFDVTIWQQVANAIDLQRVWSDNAVSITATFKQEEIPDLPDVLEFAEDKLKGITLMALDCTAYQYPPYEAITREIYETMAAEIIDELNFKDIKMGGTGESGCSTDACELKMEIADLKAAIQRQKLASAETVVIAKKFW